MQISAFIGMGSNLGDRAGALTAAAHALGQTPKILVRQISPFFETAPVGPDGQRPYLNAALLIETTLEPMPLLDRLREIECEAGRERTVRWGSRTLDLDLLLYADQIIFSEHLIVPHPRLAVRRFVLDPLAIIAPGVVDPITGCTVADLLSNLLRRPGLIAIADLDRTRASDVLARLTSAIPSPDWRVVQEPGSVESRSKGTIAPTFVVIPGLFQSDPSLLPRRIPRLRTEFLEVEGIVAETLAAWAAAVG